ncbi:MAG: 16S rRNA (cytidine(1402)-2'-O)-methyltransferase [Elusimicrobiota bacterium]
MPTPIGNLEDMTPRALSTLKSADAIYCEDTRRTRALLSHFGFSKEVLRYEDRDERGLSRMISRLKGGERLALVSDAGLPGISDPGRAAVFAARKEGLPTSALPGPSALTAALAGSGLPADSFVFLGFLPRASGKRKRLLAQAAALGKTVAVYESPFRALSLLDEAAQVLGPQTPAAAAREISKVYEEWIGGTVAEIRQTLAARAEILGEFVFIFCPRKENRHDDDYSA